RHAHGAPPRRAQRRSQLRKDRRRLSRLLVVSARLPARRGAGDGLSERHRDLVAARRCPGKRSLYRRLERAAGSPPVIGRGPALTTFNAFFIFNALNKWACTRRT